VAIRQGNKPPAKIFALRVEERERFFIGTLKFQCQRYATTDVSDAVVEDTMI